MFGLFSRRRISSRCSEEKGAVIVQFAIVLPILILIMAGIVDYGLVLRENTIMVASARAGARSAATLQAAATNPDWLEAVATDGARQYLVNAGLRAARFNFTACATGIDVNTDPTAPPDLKQAIRVTVATKNPRWYFLPQNATSGRSSSVFLVESDMAVNNPCV
jgi:Flp pilus assembly protein TadG